MKTGLAMACAFAVIIAWVERPDMAAGAWLGVGTIALTPLAIWLLAARAKGRQQSLCAVDVETLAWAQSHGMTSPPRAPKGACLSPQQ
jgi:predicted outer membrane lipoprotein